MEGYEERVFLQNRIKVNQLLHDLGLTKEPNGAPENLALLVNKKLHSLPPQVCSTKEEEPPGQVTVNFCRSKSC